MRTLEVDNLRKTYRQSGKLIEAVCGVSLTVKAGEVLAFLGPNGAGKTTSIKMIAGLIRPDIGWVKIAGCDPHRNPQALRMVGAVLEGNRNLYWRLTPEENLEYFGVLRGSSHRAARQQGLQLVLIVGILLFTIVLTGRHLHFPPSLLLPLITVLLGAYGLAFMMGALALLFKRIQQLFGLIQFALLFLLMIPTETWNGPIQGFRLLLPMTLGAGGLRELMARNQSLDFSQFAFALLNGVVYFIFGLLVFRWAESKAKRQGILGGY